MSETTDFFAVALADPQRGIYFECTGHPDSLMYNIPARVDLPKGTDISRFADAVRTVIAKHRSLHITVGTVAGLPSMIDSRVEVPVTEKTVDDFDAEFRAFFRPFDLENGPLARFEILRTPAGAVLLFDVHHIVMDGTSINVMIRQIAAVYDGEECPDEEMTVLDAAALETLPKDPARVKEFRSLFRDRLDGIDCEAKPLSDLVAGDGVSGRGCTDVLPDRLPTAGEIAPYLQEHRLTENAFFLGAFGYALAKCGGTNETCFTSVHHGRFDPRLGETFGMFVRTLPAVCSFDESMTPAAFLTGISDDYYRFKKNDCVPFSELAADYGLTGDVTFVYQAELFRGIPLADGCISAKLLETDAPVGALAMVVMREGDGYRLTAEYDKKIYSEAFIGHFLRLYETVLRGMLTADTLGEITLTDPESRAVLDRINRTEVDYDGTETVVSMFRKQAAKTPDHLCVVCRDVRMTYRRVDEMTDRLARHLVGLGVGREKVVGVLIPRSENMLICSLGVLKAGGAYLPLDPTYPPERLNLMMQDSGAMMLLYAAGMESVINDEFHGLRMPVEEISALPDSDRILPEPRPEDLLIMLYTSGSTGTPKGVQFTHANSVVTTCWVKKYFSIGEDANVTAYASYGFDANTFDMYPAVTAGATLHIIPDELRLDFPALKEYFNQNGITHTVMTTQIGRQFAQMGGFTTLRHLSVAGEKLTPPDLPDGFSLYNLYGPTEGSVVTSAFRVDRRYQDVPIGKPVDNLKIYVVDKNGRLLPVGAVGELWIAGPHVTRGYLNRPEKTAEAYGENPFDATAGYERVYRTGDIVRLLPDGNLQFVGRRDAQVKVRGFRVELTEIEEVVRRFPGIQDATVAAFDDPAGGKYVAAYVVSEDTVDPAALSDFIRAEKPPYMVPAAVMQLDAIPLNQNQKVNRRALPVPQRTYGEIVPPENELQKKILGIVAETVGHDKFGITTDFYEAGLTSIGSVRLNVALAEAFDVPLRLADIKENCTVQRLEHFLNQSAPTEQYELLEDYPITETQNGIFVECMASPDTAVYNIPVLLKLGTGVDPERLRDAMTDVINAHPYVKTRLFTDATGNVRAERRDGAPAEVELIRCPELPDTSALVRPFVLLNGSLYRTEIYVTAQGNYLYTDFHHIICDGASETVLFRDLERAYRGESLVPEAFSGFEAALEEQKLRAGERRDADITYWNGILSGCDTNCLPKKEPEAQTGAGTEEYSAPADAVLTFCEKNGVTPNAFFNAVFGFVLSRFTGKENVTYATIHNGRGDSRLAAAVTMTVRTFPVVVSPDGEMTVADFLAEMQTRLMDAMLHDTCSFAELCAEYGVNSDIIFAYQGESFALDTVGGEPAVRIAVASDTAKAPVSLNVYLQDGRFSFVAEYDRSMYSAAFARSLAVAVSNAAVSFTQMRLLKEVSMLSEEGEALYRELNDSDTEIEPILVHQMFERESARHPAEKAITSDGKTMTYGVLNALANRVAHGLIAAGVGRDAVVGVMLERSCEIPLTELGVLKSGGAFMAVLPSYPDDRVDYCLRDAESPCVITTERLKAERTALFSADKPYKTLTLEQLLATENESNPELPIDPERLAYCIYTSGSTGKPKGVMIEHRNFTNAIQTLAGLFNFYREGGKGTALASCSVSFDASIIEIYLPLCCGSHLYFSTEEEYHNPMAMRELMIRNQVRAMIGTPSFLSNLISMPELAPAFAGMQSVMVGAEAFPASLYEGLRKFSPDLQILNGYGPSECTVCCSYKELHSPNGITIGKSTGNVKLYVVDRYGNILPPYGCGELIICGAGVGRGYVKLPDKTAASYFTLRGMRAYHSGDLVRLNGDAEIDFGGRIDNQIKLRGFRIELDEIEKVMRGFPAVTQSKVLVRNNGSEDYLVGFFTAESEVGIDALTEYMKSALTYYMVPSVMMQLDQMPLTQNGKIDKNGFPEVVQAAKKKQGRRAPKKSLEQRLCEIFGTVLGIEEVFADDHFFELGGTSLSASKVTMMLMSENVEVKYGDIFDHPTPESLAEFIESRDGAAKPEQTVSVAVQNAPREALRWNRVRYAAEVTRQPLGDVLLTGAVGFLGIHILDELLRSETGHITCLVRKGSHKSAEIRLRTMLIYYFGRGYDEELRERITVIDSDITDPSLGETLGKVPFDTVINCAACVKHFSDNDILEQINVRGVENLIGVCMARNTRLVQISTVSVPGIHTAESYERQIRMHEDELFVIDDMDNKYGISKYHAELRMLDAIEKGMRGKIVRVGNLMGRHSDGEFQANMETNMFLSGIRGFSVMGKYPISHMTDPMRFSPVDCTARAVVLLAGTNDKFTAFNADNRYGFDEMKVIDACNRNGITILPEQDEVYYEEFRLRLGDDSVNRLLNGLAAYDIKDAHAVETDNLFTTNILYRIGFSWPLVDDTYLDRAIHSIMTLDYFGVETNTEE